MRYKNWTIPYIFSYLLFFFARKGYYRKVRKTGAENIPKGKPVIFAINHQNSLVDPCIVATTTLTPVYFLARSDVFKIPFVSKILHSINMMPIFRKKDGEDFKEKNLEIFAKCATILAKNGRIMIFPEGSHDVKNRLRILKKGIARIALQADLLTKKDVFIVPVGLNYSNKVNKCATLFVNYGEPINVSQVVENKLSEVENILAIMEELKPKMQNLILHCENEEFYKLYDFLLFEIKENKYYLGKNISAEFGYRKKILPKITNWIEKNKTNSIAYLSNCNLITDKCIELKVKPYLFSKQKQSVVFDFLFLLFCLPIFLYGWINNYLPYILPDKLLNSKIKDTQFHPAVNMIVGTFFFSIFWIVQTFFVSIFTDNYVWFWYFLSLPISGWLSFEYYIFYRRFMGKLNYNSLLKSNPSLMKELREKYLNLKQFKNNL